MRQRTLRAAALRAGILILAATACSDGESLGEPNDPEQPDPGTPGVTACGLITGPEFEPILGTTVSGGTEASGPQGITTCDWITPDHASIIVRLSPEIGDQEHADFPFVDPQPVEGLGDDAKYAAQAKVVGDDSPGDFGSVISVLQGTVAISIYYNGDGDRLEISTALAQVALERL
jgi:hypothetical protein